MLYKYSNGQNKTFRDGRLLKSIYFFICQTVEGKIEGKILTYINLIEKGALNVDEAARYADMSVKALKKEAKRLGASL